MTSSRPRLAGAVIAAAVATLSTVALAAPAQAAGDPDDGYYRAPYSSTIYSVESGQATALTYAQWTAAGSPTPRLATVNYEKFSWDPTIYRETWFGPWLHEANHLETPSEWAAAAPVTLEPGDLNQVSLIKWGTSDELFVTTRDGLVHKLTSREWQSELDSIPPTVKSNEGYLKLTWASPIAFSSDVAAGKGAPITYARWVADGYPTPRQAVRFPGDQFYRHSGSATIYYAGPTMNRAITYAEWTAAGRPAPTVK